MAQVVLVYPVTGLDMPGVSLWLPLSVLHVASTLAADYDVAIVDQRVEKDWPAALRKALTRDTLCVGISAMTGTQIRFGLQAARQVRATAPELPIVWGGNHATLLPEQTAAHPLVDAVVMGQGEETFRRLVDALAAGRDWRECGNICFKSDGKVVVQGSAYEFFDLAKLPPLPYHLVDVERYAAGRMMFGRPMRSLPFITSFGCPYECTFCCQPVLSKRRWLKMPPELVAERTLELARRFRLDAVEFHDEEFFVDRRRGERVAELLGGRLRWYAQTRMDDLLELNLPRLQERGLAAVQPGLESGSDRILALVKKEETLADYRAANAALARTGILTTYNFMLGFPTETPAEVAQTVDLALELLEANPNARVSGFYAFVPYPGSELYELAAREGFRPPDDLEGWSEFSRHRVLAPWIGEKEPLEYLMLTSKIIDGRRWRSTLGSDWLDRALLRPFGRRHRRRWGAHDFTMSWDARLFSLAARQFMRR